MRKSTSLVLVFMVCAGAILLSETWTRSTPTRGTDSEPETATSVSEVGTTSEAAQLESSTLEVAPERSTVTPVFQESSVNDGEKSPLEQERVRTWELEIMNLSREDIMRMANLEAETFHAELQEAHRIRYGAGHYDIVAYGSKLELSKQEQAEARNTLTIFTGSRPEGRQQEHHRTVFPANEYPELYEKRDRIQWLRRAAERQPLK